MRPYANLFGLAARLRPQAMVDGRDVKVRRAGTSLRPIGRQQHQGDRNRGRPIPPGGFFARFPMAGKAPRSSGRERPRAEAVVRPPRHGASPPARDGGLAFRSPRSALDPFSLPVRFGFDARRGIWIFARDFGESSAGLLLGAERVERLAEPQHSLGRALANLRIESRPSDIAPPLRAADCAGKSSRRGNRSRPPSSCFSDFSG